MMRWIVFACLCAGCAGSKISHRTAGDIPMKWLDSEVIKKGQPVRLVYTNGDSTFRRIGHIIESTLADHIILQYQDPDQVKIVNANIRIDAIQEISFVGSSSYDRKIRNRWIKIAGFTIAFLIYATIYASN